MIKLYEFDETPQFRECRECGETYNIDDAEENGDHCPYCNAETD